MTQVERVEKIQGTLMAAVQSVSESKELTATQQILIKGLSGAIGAGISNFVLFPLENIKTRLMLATDEEKKEGIISIINRVYQKEGISGFLAGINSYVIYSVGTYGIFFLTYEALK